MAFDLRTDFGAMGNGVDNDTSAWEDAEAALKAQGGGKLIVPYGTYRVERPNSTAPFAFSWDGVTLADVEFERGAKILMTPVDEAEQVPVVRANLCKGVRWINMWIDGAWGADVTNPNTALRTDSQDGINYETQDDPKSHGKATRGCEGYEMIDPFITQVYGDAIWIGHGAVPAGDPVPGSVGIRIIRGSASITARNGITIGGKANDVIVDGTQLTNIFSCPFDMEIGALPPGPPPPTSMFNITVRNRALLGQWWNPRGRVAASITSGNIARDITIEDCDALSSIMVQRAVGVRLRRNNVKCMWGGQGQAPIYMRWDCDRVLVEGNDVETNCVGPVVTLPNGQTVVYQDTKNHGRAAILVDYYAAGANRAAPRNVEIIDNDVRAYATDIKGMGVHGLAVGGQGEQGGLLRLEGNTYDLTNANGVSNGGRGVDIFSEKPGIDIRMRGETTRNATGPAYRTRFSGSPVNVMRHFDIDNVSASDDQVDVAGLPTPTCTAVVGIDPNKHYARADIGRVTRSVSVPADFVGWP